MAIPAFVTGGVLPTGIHDCDLTEIEARFVYNPARQTIWAAFSSYITHLKAIPEIDVVYVDGSFVTDKESFAADGDPPNDVDIVLELADATMLQTLALRLPALFDRDSVKANFKVDLLFAFEPMLPGLPDLREFFQYLRPQEAIDRSVPIGTKKGILKISVR